MPRTDGGDKAPGDRGDDGPDEIVSGCVPIRAGPDGAMLGHQVRFLLQHNEAIQGGDPALMGIDDVVEGEKADDREEQKHDGVGDDDAARTEIEGEQGVTQPGDPQGL